VNGRVAALLGRLDAALSPALGRPPDREPSPRRAAALLVGALVGGLLGAPGIVAAVALALAAGAARRRRRAREEENLLRELNDTVPLVQLAVGAGLTVRAALHATTPWTAGRLGAHLASALQRVEAGASLADELDRMPAHLGQNARGLAAVLSAGERYGSPLVEPLAVLGAELRLQRRRQLEQTARRIPVRLLFPLTLGVLPAFILLAIVPMAATALDGVVLPGR
jgi:tight adherence protein C